MDTQRYKDQHVEILQQVDALRGLAKAGVAANAEAIAAQLVAMSSGIRFHLAAEDKLVYPALQASRDPAVARLAAQYQQEMVAISQAFGDFVVRWRVAARIAAEPEAFRTAANALFAALFDRIQREERELYVAAESLSP